MLTWQPNAMRASVGRIAMLLVLLVLVDGAWWACLRQGGPGVAPYSTDAWIRFFEFIEELIGAGRPLEQISYMQSRVWRETFGLMYDTILMSVLAVTMAGVGALLLLPIGTRASPSEAKRRLWRKPLAVAVRGWFTIARAVPELVWAFLIVVVMRPGILAGALALGIHNLGVVGRLSVDLAENTDHRPLTALASNGATGSYRRFSLGS